jgi:hypothetical protein
MKPQTLLFLKLLTFCCDSVLLYFQAASEHDCVLRSISYLNHDLQPIIVDFHSPLIYQICYHSASNYNTTLNKNESMFIVLTSPD